MLALQNGLIHEGRSDKSRGLFRTRLAGWGVPLLDVFERLEYAKDISTVTHHPHRDLFGARVSLRPEEGDGYWDLLGVGRNIYVIVGNFAYKDSRIELIAGDGLIQLYFKLSGDLSMSIGRLAPLRLNRPSLTIYRQPIGVDINEWTEPRAQERCVAICVNPKYLLNNFLPNSRGHAQELHELLRSTSASVQYLQFPLSSEMFALAEKLIENLHTGIRSLLFTEAVATELLCAACASLDSTRETASVNAGFGKLARLERARKYLAKVVTPAPSVRQVARIAGMSITTLERSFKAVYGETLLDFSTRYRMQYALALLRDQRMTVGRVAEAVGYRHQSSFATAFRRHFGVRPKDARVSLASKEPRTPKTAPFSPMF